MTTAPRLSPRTVRYLHSLLRSALHYAVTTRLIEHNPSDNATLPWQERAETALARRHAGAGVSRRGEGRSLASLWMLLLTGGLRPSEALALRWSDLDLAAGRVCVQRARVRTGGGSYTFGECKTDRSRRTVTVPPEATAALRAHGDRQNAEKLIIDTEYSDTGLVFASETGRSPDYRASVLNHFEPARKRAKLPPMSPCGLRHSSASLLMAKGMHPKIVNDRLGHSTITLTMDTYSHVSPSLQEAASDTMGKLLQR